MGGLVVFNFIFFNDGNEEKKGFGRWGVVVI